MVKVVIGSMVLCHLLIPGQNIQVQQENSSNVTKVLGEVVDIQKGSRYIEKVDDKQALRVDTDILIVKGKNKEGLYQVDARACMLVRDETPQEREERVAPKTKVEEKVVEEKTEETNSADMEIQDRPAVEDVKEEEIIKNLPQIEEQVPQPQEVKEIKEEVKQEIKEAVKEEKVEKVQEKVEETPAQKTNKSLLDYIK
jgi:hypothetical protein